MAQVVDEFERSVGSGWGTSTSGHTWSNNGSAGSSVSGGVGAENVTSTGSSYHLVPVSIQNPNVVVLTQKPAISDITGGYIFQEIFLRSDEFSDNCYAITLWFDDDESGTLDIGTYVDGTYSLINFEDLPFSFGGTSQKIWVRCEATGTTIRAKAWLDGTSEPGTWLNSINDSTFTAAGRIGTFTNAEDTNSNVPFVGTWDHLVVNNTSETGQGNRTTTANRTGAATRTANIAGNLSIAAALTGEVDITAATVGGDLAVTAGLTGEATLDLDAEGSLEISSDFTSLINNHLVQGNLEVSFSAPFAARVIHPLPTKVPVHLELLIDGEWVDLVELEDLYTSDPIHISRGRQDQLQAVKPTQMDFSIENKDWKYSPRNSLSPLFGKIGRNTQARCWVGTSPPATGVDDPKWRGHGEIESWPQRWNKTGSNVWAPVTARGIMYRLGLPGQQALARSAPSRYARIQQPTAYWPMDSPRAEINGNDVQPFYAGTEIEFTPGQLAHWLPDGYVSDRREPLELELTNNVLIDECAYDFLLRLEPPLEESDNARFSTGIQFDGGGPVILITMKTDGGSGTVELSDPGTPSVDDTEFINVFDGALHHWRLHAFNNGNGDATVRAYLDGVQILQAVSNIEAFNDNNLGKAIFTPSDPLTGAAAVRFGLGQVMIWSGTPPSVSDVNDALFGHQGEMAHERIERICIEEGISVAISGSVSEELGPQPIDSPLNVMFNAQDADGGVLYEPRWMFGLGYRTRLNMVDQAVTTALDYDAGGEVAHDLFHIEDTDDLRNDVTVKRRGTAQNHGREVRVIRESGPLSVTGVGSYAYEIELNLFDDDQVEDRANWILDHGTVDEARYESINMDLTAMKVDGKDDLINDALELDIGKRLTITNAPQWVGGGTIDQLAQGFKEEIGTHHHTIETNTSPSSPWMT